uniref:Uncharacterized protein n=1 Tax=Anopheles atroparvus TaxID=41427 RepID=A0A182IQH5_ANOAO
MPSKPCLWQNATESHLGELTRALVPPADGGHRLQARVAILQRHETLDVPSAPVFLQIQVRIDHTHRRVLVDAEKSVHQMGAKGGVDVLDIEASPAGPHLPGNASIGTIMWPFGCLPASLMMFSGWMMPVQQPFGLSLAENLTRFFSSELRCGRTAGGGFSWADATPARGWKRPAGQADGGEISILPTNVPLICVSSGMSVQWVCGQITGLRVLLAGGRQVAAGGLYWMLDSEIRNNAFKL